MVVEDRYDVVIAGGGLAGLCLAIQLKRARSSTQVLVAEKSKHPAPHAAHKVGESSVEMASHYFREVLGLSDLLSDELPKFGLRFLLSSGDNTDVAKRLECGPSHFLTVPSFQIDRGQFENGLARRARELNIDFVDQCAVTDFKLGEGMDAHRVTLKLPSGQHDVRCRWLVDASGRAALLKKRLGLAKPNRHHVNAAWFRVDHPIDLDDWSDDLHWRTRLKHSRRLSTNHLMGEGYWVWLIPLAGDRTSVGIVVDDGLHPFAELSSFEKSLDWLDRHEPQCAGVVRGLVDRKMDFKALKHYSYDVKKVYSADRWCLVGEAGMFIDPFYSPGSDIIGLANSYASDLIVRDLRGEEISALAKRYDQAFRSFGHTYLMNYYQQYPLMGNGRVMCTKIVWDFVMYWGGVALIFFRGKYCDVAFMDRIRPTLHSFAHLNMSMQVLFRDWAARTKGSGANVGSFVDYAEIDCLAELNRNLLKPCNDDALVEQLSRNLNLAEEIKQEILVEASDACEETANSGESVSTAHLENVFGALRPAPRA